MLKLDIKVMNMAQNVDAAFRIFLANTVNLDSEVSRRARGSRNWLFEQIAKFQQDDTFPLSYEENDFPYGSFARHTKKRPLDDIDLLICLHAQGAHYEDTGIDGLLITVDPNTNLKALCFDGTDILSSTKVINKFVRKLAEVPQYAESDIHRDGSAAVLNLQSYEWSFDIIPAFITRLDALGRQHYLIPDGHGNWKKADPTIDSARVTRINQTHAGRVLEVIRVMKYWNGRPTMPSMGSYLLEAIILDYYDQRVGIASEYIDWEIRDALSYVYGAIYNRVNDPKGIEGDINNLSFDDRVKIAVRAKLDLEKAEEAIRLETADGNQRAAINKWREIFGIKFPTHD